MISGAEFQRALETFEHSAYRLETLDRYDTGEEDGFKRFASGRALMERNKSRLSYQRVVREAVRTGKRMERVHVVREPLSPYLQWEILWGYCDNVALGENVRLLPISATDQWPALPQKDYWMFDSSDVFTMCYDEAGHFHGCEKVEDPGQIVKHCLWRDVAWHYAVPYHRYMAERPELVQVSR